MDVLQEIWYVLCTAAKAEDCVSCEHQSEEEHSKVSDDHGNVCFLACYLVVLS